MSGCSSEKKRKTEMGEVFEGERKGVKVFDFLTRWKTKQCRFWLKFDVVTPCTMLFYPRSFDLWLALHNTHLTIPLYPSLG